MICPRCGKEVPDNETICPFCFQLVNNDMEFNNFRKDGFIALKKKENKTDETYKATNHSDVSAGHRIHIIIRDEGGCPADIRRRVATIPRHLFWRLAERL